MIGFLSPLLLGCGWHKPSLPRVPEDAADSAARRVAAEEKKKKKDTEKARARERRRARDALEKRRRQQEREGLPREPSPETPDDDDDDDDDDEEEDDMAARLGLGPGSGCGQESSSQPPRGSTPLVPGVGASGSQSEARGRPEVSPVPSAGGAEVAPEGQVRASAPQGSPLVPVAHGGDPQVTATAPGQSTSRASTARVAPKMPAKRTSAAVLGAGIQETSPQARWIMARSGWVSRNVFVLASHSYVLAVIFLSSSFFYIQQAESRPDRPGTPEGPQDGAGLCGQRRPGPCHSADPFAGYSIAGGSGVAGPRGAGSRGRLFYRGGHRG
jgi:hypothetical protein